MTRDVDVITRRDALKRTALLLGGVLAASTIDAAERVVWAATPGWAPRTLSGEQLEMVAAIAEHIIPTTDTPGARAAGVHRLVDVLLTDYYAPAERDRFLAGLRATNIRAIRVAGAPFLRCTPDDQIALLTALDAEAFPSPAAVAATDPQSSERLKMRDSLQRAGSTGATSVQPPSASGDGALNVTHPELRNGWFFRRMKELTLLGYYTSRIGSTRELHVNPMGSYRGDLPYSSIGRAWA